MASDTYRAIEQSLIAKAQSGNEAAFTEILQRYKRRVLDFIYRMTGDPDAAQDLAHERVCSRQAPNPRPPRKDLLR